MSTRAWARTLPLLLPLVLVNTAAIYGQAGWAYDHLIHHWLIAAAFAAAVESIGVYLAFEAHAALMAGDASARLRAGSYLIGALAGVLNYAHFASAGYRPNPLAVTFAAMSSISPWLWAIRSRSMNRARLRELGQIDPRAVRFALLRWLLFPLRTVRAFRVAVWHGIVTPAEAVARSGVKAPGVAAGTAGTPLPVLPGEAMTLAEVTMPREVADPAAFPARLPQVIHPRRVADLAADLGDEDPANGGRKAAPALADRVRATTAALAAAGVSPRPALVARIVGVENSPHVARTVRTATKEDTAEVSRPTTPTPPPRPDRARKERSADDRDQHARTAPPQGDVVGGTGESTARGRLDGLEEGPAPDPGTPGEDG
jgi:hypothetical protein